MIYFSELKGKNVDTEDSINVGRLEDLIFLASETPKITKLVIGNSSNNKIIVSIEYLEKFNSDIVIKKDYKITELEENELYILKNIQDKQIIDLKGNKIVRVNDIVLQQKDGLYLVGVDIGILGILRWLKIEEIFTKFVSLFRFKLTSQFLSWADIQPLELSRGKVRLKKEEKGLKKLKPEDLAGYLESTNIVNTRKILKLLDDKYASLVIGNLNINYQGALFRHFHSEKAAKFLNYIDLYEAVDILLYLSVKKRNEILDYYLILPIRFISFSPYNKALSSLH